MGMSQLEQSGLAEETERHSAFVAAAAKVDGFIAVIESRTFLQDCIRRSARLALPLPIITYSTVFELEQQRSPASQPTTHRAAADAIRSSASASALRAAPWR